MSTSIKSKAQNLKKKDHYVEKQSKRTDKVRFHAESFNNNLIFFNRLSVIFLIAC